MKRNLIILLLLVFLLAAALAPLSSSQGPVTADRLRRTTFANLSSTDDNVRYCTDCQVGTGGVCASGGTGARATRINGNWYCDVDVVGRATTDILSNKTFAQSLLPDGAGTRYLGSSLKPFSGLYIGGAVNQRTLISSNATAQHTAIFPDKDGTVAFLDDITAGITNSAASGVVPVTVDGSGNLGTSPITYDGNNVQVTSGLRANVSTGRVDLGDINHTNANAFVDPDVAQAQIAAGATTGAYFEEGSEAELFGPKVSLNAPIISAQGTVTAGGTTGAQTINKSAGSVNFAATATSLVVTNSTVTTSSIIICTVGTNDATLKSVQCVAGTGSFTMFGNAAAAAESRVNFWVITPQ